ncbi:N-6 DNA methylase [Coleofasciculus sp. G2-EDA-02]|uniref:N-6 DNA methylase n=1 Tax=Coleofasciculus sp. G2-EDA-02 TaxID=3069529 RepID=UPI0032F1AAE0
MVTRKTKYKLEFGDFQTPDDLAYQIVQTLKNLNINPQSVIEPTCGQGAFLLAAAAWFPGSPQFIGVDINRLHLDILQKKIITQAITYPIKTICASFFEIDWSKLLADLPEPILVLGNPPWVTSAALGKQQGANLPVKSNFQKRKGLDALTGKSNFDISEWMLIQHLEWLKRRTGIIAMLCKTAVARKVLVYAWKHDLPIQEARLYQIDSSKYFNAAVDACLFVLKIGDIIPSEKVQIRFVGNSHPNDGVGLRNETQPTNLTYSPSKTCHCFEHLCDQKPSNTIGYYDDRVIADMENYKQLQHLSGIDKNYIWRSGLKHDCAKIMELVKNGQGYQNGYGVTVSLEDTYLYPLLKSSDIANDHVLDCRKYLLVTQRYIGEETSYIQNNAPKTWNYLQNNAEALFNRKSSVYKKRLPFSIFGVGSYTFSPWKIAISGFYKKLNFKLVRPIGGKPVVFDDTVYFLPCWFEQEAQFITELLNSNFATLFLESMIFWSDKRPITIDVLKRLNIQALARELNREDEYIFYVKQRMNEGGNGLDNG